VGPASLLARRPHSAPARRAVLGNPNSHPLCALGEQVSVLIDLLRLRDEGDEVDLAVVVHDPSELTFCNPYGVPNVYKVTYPNGKIFVIRDPMDQITYIEPIANDQFLADFTTKESKNFTVRKEVLWESADAGPDEVARVEVEWIHRLRANNPDVGYNRWPLLSE
jgi:hypothetical protein